MINRMAAWIDRASHHRGYVAAFIVGGALAAMWVGYDSGVRIGEVIFR